MKDNEEVKKTFKGIGNRHTANKFAMLTVLRYHAFNGNDKFPELEDDKIANIYVDLTNRGYINERGLTEEGFRMVAITMIRDLSDIFKPVEESLIERLTDLFMKLDVKFIKE